MTIWLYDYMTIWLYDYTTMWPIWLHDYRTIWLYDYLTIWLYDCVTLWVYDCMTIWLYDCVTLWVYDYMTIWLHDYMTICTAQMARSQLCLMPQTFQCHGDPLTHVHMSQVARYTSDTEHRWVRQNRSWINCHSSTPHYNPVGRPSWRSSMRFLVSPFLGFSKLRCSLLLEYKVWPCGYGYFVVHLNTHMSKPVWTWNLEE